jgi:hypothetical protein
MTNRVIDTNGWAEIRGNPISKVGVFPYLGRSIGAPEPSRIYMVYRPEEELADPACIESFRLLPWVDEHEMLGSEDTGYIAPEKKGIQGVIGEDVYYEDGVLKGNIKVFSESLAALIHSGKRELSAGYRCQYEFTCGQYNGQRYDAIQRKIRGNHLASVHEGRLGPDVAVLDHMTFTFDAKELLMTNTSKATGQDEDVSLADVVKQLIPLVQALVGSAPSASPDGDVDPSVIGDDAPTKTPVEEDDDTLPAEDEDDDSPAAKGDKETEDEQETAQAMDAAIKALRTASKTAPKAMRASMDSAIAGLRKAYTAAQTQSQKPRKTVASVDAAEVTALRARVAQLERSAAKGIMSEISKRDALASRLSAHIGTFDHADKTLVEVARYGVSKLGIACAKGQEIAALDGYLHGREAPKPGQGMDAKHPTSSELDQYLQGV